MNLLLLYERCFSTMRLLFVVFVGCNAVLIVSAKAKLMFPSHRLFSVCSPNIPGAPVVMTKLLEWLFGVSVLGAVWASVCFDVFGLELPRSCREAAWPMPLYLLVSFGCYSLATVGYRVATFNDCDEAAKELREQIKEAKEDLRKKGLNI